MSKKVLFVEGRREGYGIDQIRRTMTAGELIEFLNELPEDAEIYLNNDNGYTYGSITESSMEINYVVKCPECGREVIFNDYGNDDGNWECRCGENLYDLIEW